MMHACCICLVWAALKQQAQHVDPEQLNLKRCSKKLLMKCLDVMIMQPDVYGGGCQEERGGRLAKPHMCSKLDHHVNNDLGLVDPENQKCQEYRKAGRTARKLVVGSWQKIKNHMFQTWPTYDCMHRSWLSGHMA